MTYDTSGKLTVSRPGLYFVYAAVEGDPMNGHMRAGYSITLNGNLAIARSFYTRPYTIGTHDDSIMFVGTMRYLDAGDWLNVVITHPSFYEVKQPYCFGVFQIR